MAKIKKKSEVLKRRKGGHKGAEGKRRKRETENEEGRRKGSDYVSVLDALKANWRSRRGTGYPKSL